MRHSTLRRKADSTQGIVMKKLLLMWSMIQAFAGERLEGHSSPGANASLVQRAQHAQTVITVVVIGVVAMVGILIFAQVDDAMPEVDGPLNDTQTSVTEGFGNALEFVPIIMLVLLAAVVIAVVQRMRA